MTPRGGHALHRPVAAALVAMAALVLSLVQGASAAWSSFVTKAAFDQTFFPGHLALYSYENLKTAAEGSFSAFGNSGSPDDQKRELAAFFAHVNHESGGLKQKYEQGCDTKCQQGYCDKGRPEYPCSETQPPYYFGRGPLQLSWNYNYGVCGQKIKQPLLANPGLISTNGRIAFQTAIWFWMQENGCHAKILGNSFSGTTKAINGDKECKNGGHYTLQGHQQMLQRVEYYKSFCQTLKVNPGPDLEC
jgi:chitinase